MRMKTQLYLFAALGSLAATNNSLTTHAFTPSSLHLAVPHGTRTRIASPSSQTKISQLFPSGQRYDVSRTFLQMTTSSTLPDAQSMRVGELKKELESYGISTKIYLEKSELVEAVEKARAEGKTPVAPGSAANDIQDSSSSSSSSTSSPEKSREERLIQEIEKCKSMKSSELKKELESYGISTASFFEKSEFVQACAEARVDGASSKKTTKSTASKNSGEGYAEYSNVEVITDDNTGPRNNSADQPKKGTGMRSGGPGIGNPFAGPGMNMGFMQDMMKNMGGMGGGGNPFAGGSPFGGANPFGGSGGMPGGMGGDAMKKAQEMMSNPKVMEIMMKAQSNPKIMKAVQECMGNPAAFAKYRNDPDVGELIRELQRYM